jgi:hypothetical protein
MKTNHVDSETYDRGLVMIDPEKIARRAEARGLADECLLLCDDLDEDQKLTFLKHMIKNWVRGDARIVIAEPDSSESGDYDQVAAYELQFGKYAGENLHDVGREDADYLDWLVEQTENLLKSLHAFTKHPTTKENRRRIAGFG